MVGWLGHRYKLLFGIFPEVTEAKSWSKCRAQGASGLTMPCSKLTKAMSETYRVT